MCAWLGSVDSLVNHDLEIQHLKKVVFWDVKKVVMEHLVKLYREAALGYRLPYTKICGNTLHYLSFWIFIILFYFLKEEDKMQIESLLLLWDFWIEIK